VVSPSIALSTSVRATRRSFLTFSPVAWCVSGYPIYVTYAFLAGAEAAKGNDAEAKSALAEARRLNPQLTIKFFAEKMPALPIVIDGLRKAGLPEE
jgi:hypothetical protein